MSKALTVSVIVLLLFLMFVLNSKHNIETEFNKYKKEQLEHALELNRKIRTLEQDNLDMSIKNQEELSKVRSEYETTLNVNKLNNDKRLRTMGQRLTYYEQLATTSTAECRDVIERTARLDRSLEEGRQLVIRLRAELVLRDGQLNAVGKQLLADRKLIEDLTKLD